MSGAPQIFLLLLIGGIAAAFVVMLRRHGLKVIRAAEQWGRGSRMTDEDFLCYCQIADDRLPQRVALAARHAIAGLADVPPETILPDHSFAHDLIRLPFWDSLDWLGFIFEVERQLDDMVLIPGNPIDVAHAAAGGWKDLQVRHVVLAVSAAAKERTFSEAPESLGVWSEITY